MGYDMTQPFGMPGHNSLTEESAAFGASYVKYVGEGGYIFQRHVGG